MKASGPMRAEARELDQSSGTTRPQNPMFRMHWTELLADGGRKVSHSLAVGLVDNRIRGIPSILLMILETVTPVFVSDYLDSP